MASNDDSQDQDQQEEKPYVRMKREDIQAMEQAAQAAKQVPELQKELAMARAGIDTESKLGKMFFKTYEGELTKEAIAAEAQEIGLLERQGEQQEIPAEEKE